MKSKLLFFGLLLSTTTSQPFPCTPGENILLANKDGDNIVIQKWLVEGNFPAKKSSYGPYVSTAKHCIAIAGALYSLVALKQLTDQDEIDQSLPQEAFIKAVLRRKKLEDKVWKGIGATVLAGIIGYIIELSLPPTHSLDIVSTRLVYTNTTTVPDLISELNKTIKEV